MNPSRYIPLALSAGFAAAGCTAETEGDGLPNVVFILADDLGYGDLSIYNPSGRIHTPVLDNMAREGIRFTNAHSSASVSTPTRYGLMTGNYPWRGPLKQGVIWTWSEPLLGNAPTLPGMLREQGYATGLVGKWHLGITFDTRDGKPVDKAGNGINVDYTKPIIDGPVDHGFDYYYGDDVPNFPPYVFIENDRFTEIPDREFPAEGVPGVPGIMSSSWDPQELLAIETEKSISYIHTHKDEPFFLMVSLTAPHTPIAPADEFIGTSSAGRYGDFVQEIDFRVGEILKALKDTGIDDKTIVIFSSDNGSSFQDGGSNNGELYAGRFGSILDHGHNPSADFRGMKSDAWEGGHRVPFIVRWPDVIAPNSVSDDLVCDIDIFATLAEIRGFVPPRGTAFDSRSILPVLTGSGGIREDLVTQSGNGILSYVDGGWKLITCSGSGGSLNPFEGRGVAARFDGRQGIWENVQLYKIDTDPFEMNDLAPERPEIVNDMMRRLAGIVQAYNYTGAWSAVDWITDLNLNKTNR